MNPRLAGPEPTKQVGIWIRVSTEDQAEGESPKHHEARARAYALAKGWVVREVYDLAGVSGKGVITQPEAKRMMADIKRGHITGLIFSKLARLARNTRELLDFSDHFRAHSAALVSIQESIDTSTPSGRLFYTMIAAMAQWEREEIVDRINASIAIRAKLGQPISGKYPFGYQWKDGKVQPHPEEAPVRKLVYEMFAQHKRLRTVARLMNEKGYRARAGKFSDTTIRRLITDPTAKGLHRTNYTKNLGTPTGKWAFKPEHEWIINKVEPIVSEELWAHCNGLLEQRRTTGIRPGPKPTHPFSGRVFCGCGAKMDVPTGTGKYVCASCKRKIPLADLDAIFHEELKGYLSEPEKVAAYLNGMNEAVADRVKLRAALRREDQTLKQKMDGLLNAYNKGGLTVEQFRDKYQPMDARQKQIAAELLKCDAEIQVLKIEETSGEQVMAEAQTFYERWPGMTGVQKHELLENILERVEVHEGEVSIKLACLPSGENIAERQRTHRGSSRPRA